MGKTRYTDAFRKNASQEECNELLEYFNTTTSTDWDTERYHFSKASAKNILIEKGLLAAAPSSELEISSKKLEFNQHTVYVTDETWTRLQGLYDTYHATKNTYVLDAFLKKALDDLGL